VLAKLNITQTANKITISAKEEVVINGGSSYSRWNSGGIEHGTSGTWREHAAVHSLVGPASEGKPSLPNPTPLPKGQLDLYHQYIKRRREAPGRAQGDYTVVDSEGGTHAGTLDRNGFASVAGLPIGTAKVTFGKDPRDPWDEGSYFGAVQALQQGGAKALLGQVAQAAPGMASRLLPATPAMPAMPAMPGLSDRMPGRTPGFAG
jgi:type VI secretion system secreted protein VgrG